MTDIFFVKIYKGRPRNVPFDETAVQQSEIDNIWVRVYRNDHENAVMTKRAHPIADFGNTDF